jgi:D-alanyl-D-alanine carboxypeptidase
MSQIDTQHAFAQDVAHLLIQAQERGYTVTLGEAWRTPEQQAIYLKTGRSKVSKSQHMSRLAVDLNLFQDGKLCTREQIKPLGDWWEAISLAHRWGGNWRGLVDAGKSSFVDAPHFEVVA